MKKTYFLFGLFIVMLFPFNVSSQNNNCGGTPPNIPIEAACSNPTAWNNNQNGTLTTGMTPSCAVAGGDYQDVWFSVIGTGLNITIDLINPSRNSCVSAWSACGLGAEIPGACAYVPSGSTGSINFASVLGTTYYIQIQRRGGNNNADANGDICAYDGVGVPPPANDTPCGAIAIPVGASCTMNTYSNDFSTDSGVPNPGCANYQGGDIWFTAIVPPSGNLIVQTGATLDISDTGMALYTGPCGALTQLSCDDDGGPGLTSYLNIGTEPPGTTIWIRVWDYSGNQFGDIDICAYEGGPVGPCGNPINNDWCDSPAILTAGPGNWSSTTSGVFTADTPADLASEWCGSIENNSYYQFTASTADGTAPQAEFEFIFIGNCAQNQGIQAEIYSMTNDANGCCTDFASVSNCESPGNPGLFTITANTVDGQTYMLVIDGFAGDGCDFTVTNWTATGILPVELVDLQGMAMPRENIILWKTISEKNNDYFNVQRTYNGINYETIGVVDGAGNSTETIQYEFNDEDIRSGVTYYRLQQVDFDGKNEFSQVIPINRTTINKSGLIAAYPNPTSEDITIEFNIVNRGSGIIQIIDTKGNILIQDDIFGEGYMLRTYDMSSFERGVYFAKYADSKESSVKKIIKK